MACAAGEGVQALASLDQPPHPVPGCSHAQKAKLTLLCTKAGGPPDIFKCGEGSDGAGTVACHASVGRGATASRLPPSMPRAGVGACIAIWQAAESLPCVSDGWAALGPIFGECGQEGGPTGVPTRQSAAAFRLPTLWQPLHASRCRAHPPHRVLSVWEETCGLMEPFSLVPAREARQTWAELCTPELIAHLEGHATHADHDCKE